MSHLLKLLNLIGINLLHCEHLLYMVNILYKVVGNNLEICCESCIIWNNCIWNFSSIYNLSPPGCLKTN